MNWVLISVLAILVISIIRGYRKGFLRIAYSLVAWILMMAFTSWLTPYISDFLVENTGVYTTIEQNCEQRLREKANEKVEEQTQETKEEVSASDSEMKKLLSEFGIALPDSVGEKVCENIAGTAGELLEQSGVYESIAKGMADFILNGISFFLALLLAILISRVIERCLALFSRIPILGGINRLLGLFAGAVYGMCLICLAFYLIAICSSSEFGKFAYSYIQENGMLLYLYENNPLVTLIMSFFS